MAADSVGATLETSKTGLTKSMTRLFCKVIIKENDGRREY